MLCQHFLTVLPAVTRLLSLANGLAVLVVPICLHLSPSVADLISLPCYRLSSRSTVDRQHKDFSLNTL